MLTPAFRAPVAVGVKVTVIVQLASGARLDGQSLVCAKSPLFVPTTAKPVTLTLELPMFVRVEGRGLLVVPTL